MKRSPLNHLAFKARELGPLTVRSILTGCTSKAQGHATSQVVANVCLALSLTVMSTSLLSCTSQRNTAYTSQSETQRNPIEAQRLTQQAAKIITSDPEKAEELLREALVADIFHGPAHNNLGIIHLTNGDLYEAANEFEWARKLMPGHPDPRLNLAITLEKAGQTKEALATYQTTLEVYPGYIPAIEAITRLAIRNDSLNTNQDQPTISFKELNSNLKQIALRGSSQEWRTWATAQLAKANR